MPSSSYFPIGQKNGPPLQYSTMEGTLVLVVRISPAVSTSVFFTLRMSKEEVNNNNKEEKILWMLINVDA